MFLHLPNGRADSAATTAPTAAPTAIPTGPTDCRSCGATRGRSRRSTDRQARDIMANIAGAIEVVVGMVIIEYFNHG